MDNATQPTKSPLSEADRADAEWFLAEMLVIFPLLGVDAFEDASEQIRESDGGSHDPWPDLYLRVRGVDARGRETGDGFVVLKGSRGRAQEVDSILEGLRSLRRQLLDRGVLELIGHEVVLTQDFRFGSPSAAAGVLVGSAINGRDKWKDGSGVSLKAIQEARATG